MENGAATLDVPMMRELPGLLSAKRNLFVIDKFVDEEPKS
jgi:hypothetical protein